MLRFAGERLKKPRQMDVDIWQFLTLFPWHIAYRMRPVECAEGNFGTACRYAAKTGG